MVQTKLWTFYHEPSIIFVCVCEVRTKKNKKHIKKIIQKYVGNGGKVKKLCQRMEDTHYIHLNGSHSYTITWDRQ